MRRAARPKRGSARGGRPQSVLNRRRTAETVADRPCLAVAAVWGQMCRPTNNKNNSMQKSTRYSCTTSRRLVLLQSSTELQKRISRVRWQSACTFHENDSGSPCRSPLVQQKHANQLRSPAEMKADKTMLTQGAKPQNSNSKPSRWFTWHASDVPTGKHVLGPQPISQTALLKREAATKGRPRTKQ
jgi:hypothetical protein